jgi:alkyldihydroxyacetonephosphate synthase
LVFTFEGDEELNRTQNRILGRIISENKVKDLGPRKAENWWNYRYNVSYNTPPIYKAGCFTDTCEVATSWTRLSDLYYKLKNAVAGDAFIMAHFSHAYLTGGNIYFTIVGQADNSKTLLKKYFKIWDKILKVCIREKAAISHHHGIGYLKGAFLKEQLGDLFPIFEQVKSYVDPDNILNPGKMGLS